MYRPEASGVRWQLAFDRLVAQYDRVLTWVLDRPSATLLVAALTLGVTAALYIFIPKGLFPTQDTGQLMAEVRARESVSFSRMADLQQAVASAILRDKDVESLSSFVGVDGANSTALNRGRMLINLKPHGARTRRPPSCNGCVTTRPKLPA